MNKQNKDTEIDVGSGTPEEKWLEDPLVYYVKRNHLELLKVIQLKGQLILDAGCGPGTYGIILAEAGNEVVGLEISPEGIKVAGQRAKEKKVSLYPVAGDLEKLPFEDNSFDICFCGWVLHHFPGITDSMVELIRVLKPGGKIALAEPNESNLAMRFSRFVEDLPVLRRWTLNAGWDTPNRTVHRHEYYIKEMEQHGIEDIQFTSCFPGGLPPLIIKSQKQGLPPLSRVLIHILFYLRRLIFITAFKVLPRPLNGADLLVTGVKRK